VLLSIYAGLARVTPVQGYVRKVMWGLASGTGLLGDACSYIYIYIYTQLVDGVNGVSDAVVEPTDNLLYLYRSLVRSRLNC